VYLHKKHSNIVQWGAKIRYIDSVLKYTKYFA